eukprot:172974_1
MTLQNQYFLAEDIIEDDSDSDCEIKEQAMDVTLHLWDNKPNCISECTVAQIICILNQNDIMENLKKLMLFRDEIIKYVHENDFDGEKNSEHEKKTIYCSVC